MNTREKGLIQSVDRALRILESFSDENKELGVSEIARRLDLHKSTAHGLITTLENRGYLVQNPDNGKYRLGLKLFELGTMVAERMELRAIAYPYLKKLVDDFQETAHLVVSDKGEVVYIDKINSVSEITINSFIGKRNPMHCTGVGKCLLAYAKLEQIQEVINSELKAFTKNTIVDGESLVKELEKIRLNGYSYDDEEIEMGLRCVAAPIRDYTGEVIAAISVAGPSFRIGEKLEQLRRGVQEAADQVSRNLGYRK